MGADGGLPMPPLPGMGGGGTSGGGGQMGGSMGSGSFGQASEEDAEMAGLAAMNAAGQKRFADQDTAAAAAAQKEEQQKQFLRRQGQGQNPYFDPGWWG